MVLSQKDASWEMPLQTLPQAASRALCELSRWDDFQGLRQHKNKERGEIINSIFKLLSLALMGEINWVSVLSFLLFIFLSVFFHYCIFRLGGMISRILQIISLPYLTWSTIWLKYLINCFKGFNLGWSSICLPESENLGQCSTSVNKNMLFVEWSILLPHL